MPRGFIGGAIAIWLLIAFIAALYLLPWLAEIFLVAVKVAGIFVVVFVVTFVGGILGAFASKEY
jgi:hypothetical protein